LKGRRLFFMIDILPEPVEDHLMKLNQAYVVDIEDGRLSIALCCPGCGQVFIPAGPRHQFNPETKSMSPSIVHSIGCGFHKTLTNGEWN
jgi:hypothetical protein